MTTQTADAMLDERWSLSTSVALRPEPFGALAYHFANRRLTFLKRPELVAVVRALAGSTSVRGALESAEVPPVQWPAYLAALRGLASSDMLQLEGTAR
ncbi:mycofactocin biosynthesis chaperone MftB [Solicola sp. PLA-1-18]|uniref:mycofactocin biosynthesis chaperone MftB n=1 Tax=Solicola sp. PLA-1-18 TaxID=3380532 RepID=UPI003B7EC7A9